MADTPKWAVRWQRQRAAGSTRYVLRTGVFGYGLAMFAAMTFFVNPPAVLDAQSILLNGFLWAVAGALFGVATWWLMERRYQQHLKDSSTTGGGSDAAPP